MSNASTPLTIAVIGGTGMKAIEGLTVEEVREVDTPFGPPSSPITVGELAGARMLFLSRHGAGHAIPPSAINYRANIYALKTLGAAWCVSVSAVGSLQEELAPGHLVLPDQLIDRTTRRVSSFFGTGLVGHVPFGTPYCPVLHRALTEAAAPIAEDAGTVLHRSGTYICIEGPQFSTRAESNLYRSWGATLIGMTALPEAKLAREAELAYATLALVTDYDCWRSAEADVDVEELLATMAKNVSLAKRIVGALPPLLRDRVPPPMVRDALAGAILTEPTAVARTMRQDLAPLVARYLG